MFSQDGGIMSNTGTSIRVSRFVVCVKVELKCY